MLEALVEAARGDFKQSSGSVADWKNAIVEGDVNETRA
jgi:hypothetical protein